MKCPLVKEEWDEIANQFLIRWQIHNTIGAINGKHFEINHVRTAGSMYFNYKGQHNIILMVMVDDLHRFIYIDVGVNGRVSDAGVFAQTTLYKI